MQKWLRKCLTVIWKVLGIAVGVAVVFTLVGLVVSIFWDRAAAFRSDVWAWLTKPSELGRFGWEALTGPPAASALAVIAALIAYTGIKKQVAESKRDNDIASDANLETARKNAEERWWDTLKWVYTEAQVSTTGTPPENETSTFTSVAALQILASLKDDTDIKLNLRQERAVLSILTIFEGSQDPKVQNAAAPIRRSFGDLTDRAYQNAVAVALDEIDLGSDVILRRNVLLQVQGQTTLSADFLVSTADREVTVDLRNPVALDKKHLSVHSLRSVNDSEKEYKDYILLDPQKRALVTVINASLDESADAGGMAKEFAQATQRKYKYVTAVAWAPGDPPQKLEESLRHYLYPPKKAGAANRDFRM